MNQTALLRGLLLLLGLWLGAGTGTAHPILQNPVWIEASPEKVTLRLDVSVRELIVVQKLETSSDGSVEVELAAEYAERHRDYLLDHFHVKADGRPLTGNITGITPPRQITTGLEGPDRAHFRYHIDYPLTTPPAVLSFSQDMCKEFPSAPGVPWDLSYAYRYGPPGATPLKFGALLRDNAITFHTGFAGTAATTPSGTGLTVPSEVTRTRPVPWTVLWILFAAAMGLNRALPKLWIKTGAVLWMGGYLAAGLSDHRIPEWLPVLAAGAVTILAAADNIYTWAGDSPEKRRRALLLTGCLVFGWGLSPLQPAGVSSARLWMVLLVILPIVTAAAMAGLKTLLKRKGVPALRGFIQLTSLALCLAAIRFMLELLDVAF